MPIFILVLLLIALIIVFMMRHRLGEKGPLIMAGLTGISVIIALMSIFSSPTSGVDYKGEHRSVGERAAEIIAEKFEPMSVVLIAYPPDSEFGEFHRELTTRFQRDLGRRGFEVLGFIAPAHPTMDEDGNWEDVEAMMYARVLREALETHPDAQAIISFAGIPTDRSIPVGFLEGRPFIVVDVDDLLDHDSLIGEIRRGAVPLFIGKHPAPTEAVFQSSHPRFFDINYIVVTPETVDEYEAHIHGEYLE